MKAPDESSEALLRYSSPSAARASLARGNSYFDPVAYGRFHETAHGPLKRRSIQSEVWQYAVRTAAVLSFVTDTGEPDDTAGCGATLDHVVKSLAVLSLERASEHLVLHVDRCLH